MAHGWSELEMELLFQGISRYSKFDIESIQREINTKSEIEVSDMIQRLSWQDFTQEELPEAEEATVEECDEELEKSKTFLQKEEKFAQEIHTETLKRRKLDSRNNYLSIKSLQSMADEIHKKKAQLTFEMYDELCSQLRDFVQKLMKQSILLAEERFDMQERNLSRKVITVNESDVSAAIKLRKFKKFIPKYWRLQSTFEDGTS